MTHITTLPYDFDPYPQQREIMQAFFNEGYKRFVTVAHRRFGKDMVWLNIIIGAMMERVGMYLYFFPELKQGKHNIWRAMDIEGRPLLDYFPSQLISTRNETENWIRFKNGSIFQLGCSNKYLSYKGSNAVGIVFSEYSTTNPAAWAEFSPILRRNKGWAAFLYTPKGKNHAYNLFQMANENTEVWKTTYLPVNETCDQKGNRLITQEEMDEEVKTSGLSQEEIDQEYYLKWEAAVKGAYYSHELKMLYEQDRVKDFPIETNLKVHTFWDLGVNDSTAIWFFQSVGMDIRVIYYLEHQGEGLPYYADVLEQLQTRFGFVWGDHWAPFDIAVKEWGNGRTRIQTALDLGIRFQLVPNISIMDGINAVRSIFPRLWFHKTHCEIGLNALTDYQRDFDPINKIFSPHPKRNWATHGADAFRYFAVGWLDLNRNTNAPPKKIGWNVYKN